MDGEEAGGRAQEEGAPEGRTAYSDDAVHDNGSSVFVCLLYSRPEDTALEDEDRSDGQTSIDRLFVYEHCNSHQKTSSTSGPCKFSRSGKQHHSMVDTDHHVYGGGVDHSI